VLSALDGVEVSMWGRQMDGLHSLMLLVDTALSAEPSALTGDPAALKDLRKKLTMIKQRVGRYRGLMDYHGLECESLAAFIGNKIEHLYLAAP